MSLKYGWDSFLFIEEKFLEAKNYVAFEEKNYDTYSLFFSNIIVLLGTRIEAAFKELCSHIDNTQTPGNIGQYKGIILKEYPNIEKCETQLIDSNLKFQPFDGWSNKKLNWWNCYTNLKHNLAANKLNLKVALDMLSAYFILLLIIQTRIRINLGQNPVSDAEMIDLGVNPKSTNSIFIYLIEQSKLLNFCIFDCGPAEDEKGSSFEFSADEINKFLKK